MDNSEKNQNGIPTLEQFCRALAAHAIVTSHNNHLHSFMAPEMCEGVAKFIFTFALGEPADRPQLEAEDGY